jgi:uncharacterized protein (DUF58 family)
MHGLKKSRSSINIDKRQLEEKGVILPIKRLPIRFLPGRHLLGRAGDGMRFLRSRPFDSLEDNPRDIDKFSPKFDLTVNEWEHETQAEILLLVDASASMSFPLKQNLRDAVVLQLIYSLWRAGDRVRVALFADDTIDVIHEPNLQTEMEQYQRAVSNLPFIAETDFEKTLDSWLPHYTGGKISLIIMVSDFIEPAVSGSITLPIANLRRLQGDLINIVISFNLGEDLQGVGKFWDPERNREGIIMMSRRRRERINNAEKGRVDTFCREMRDVNVDTIAISELRQVYPSLFTLARTREHRRL